MLLLGPPGSGKVPRAKEMAEELPLLDGKTATDLAWIYYGAGIDLSRNIVPPSDVPFRAPHHTCSRQSLVGDVAFARIGPNVPPTARVRPGEASLAHGGCLLLDELGEFSRTTIDALALVLGGGSSGFLVGKMSVRLPARPRLVVGTANLCPCGALGTFRACTCAPSFVSLYTERVKSFAEKLGLRETIRTTVGGRGLPTP